MRVAALQYKPQKGERAASEQRLLALLRTLEGPLDLVVLPEMALTGYLFADPDDVGRVAEPADGPTLALLAPEARRLEAYIVCGFPERADTSLYNSALVVGPDGALHHVYRKTLLYLDDERWAEPGNTPYRVVTTRNGSFAVGICMDLNDDNFTDWLAQTQPRAIAFPTNWIEQGMDIWPYWAGRTAHCGGALVAADTYGPETYQSPRGPRRTTFWGCSAILDAPTEPDGPSLLWASAGKVGDAVIRAELPPR